MMYSIYHIPEIKIGCSKSIERRMKAQNFDNYEILEQHDCVYYASRREMILQKQYGLPVDNIPYHISLKNIQKALGVTQTHPNTLNMDRKAISLKSQAIRIKPLLQYDLEGNFIKRWNISSRAMKQTQYPNAHGAANPNSKNKTIYGYIWRYEEGNKIPNKINKFINTSFQKIIQLDKNGNEIKIWDNQTIAAKEIGISTQAISQCAKGKSKTAGGYKWKKYEK